MIKTEKKLYIFLLLLITSIFYLRVFFLDFVWDDIPQVIHNTTVKNFDLINMFIKDGEWGIAVRETKTPYYRPIFILSLAIDYLIAGENPAFFHTTNLILHLLLTLAIFYTLSYYFEDKFYAFLGSLFVALYPARAEAVVYVSARLHILGALFSILTFYLLKRYFTENNKKLYYLSVLTFFLSIFSFEMSLFLPVFVILENGFSKLKNTVKILAPHIVLIIIYFLARWLVLTKYIWFDVPFPTKFFTGLATFVKYLEIIFFPFNLKTFYENFDYFKKNIDLDVAFGFVLLSLLIYSLYISYKKNRVIFLGLLWFLLTFFFVSNIPYLMYPSLIAERYLYFPLIGLAFIIPECFRVSIKDENKKKIIIVSVTILFLIPAFYSIYKRTTPYKNNLLFWQEAIKDAPKNTYALDQLAQVYLGMNNYFEALRLYEIIAEINPGDFDNYTKMGNFYLKFGNYLNAEIYYNKALEIKEYDEAYWGLARVNILKNDFEKAKIYLEKAIKISPHKKKYRESLQSIR